MPFPMQDIATATAKSQQLWMPALILPKNEPADSQSGLDGGPQDGTLAAGLSATDSFRGWRTTALSSVPTDDITRPQQFQSNSHTDGPS